MEKISEDGEYIPNFIRTIENKENKVPLNAAIKTMLNVYDHL